MLYCYNCNYTMSEITCSISSSTCLYWVPLRNKPPLPPHTHTFDFTKQTLGDKIKRELCGKYFVLSGLIHCAGDNFLTEVA